MQKKRQAHGMIKVKDYVYCCAGLDGYNILDCCERYNIKTNQWSADVPTMKKAKFSMTLMLLDNSWLYSFGGATYDF